MRMCYLGHLRAQVDLSQVDGLWQQVVEQLAQQHAISEGLSQVTNLSPHATNQTEELKEEARKPAGV